MNKLMSALGVGFRLFLGWWGLGILVCSLLGGATGLGVGLLFFPWVAAAMALTGMLRQVWELRDLPQVRELGSTHHAVLQAPLSAAEAEREVAAILQGSLGAATLSVSGPRIHALFQPPAWGGWWRKQVQADECIVTLRPATAEAGRGCTLEVEARPLNGLIYGFLQVDGGRNLRRLRRFQEAFAERLAAEALRQETLRRSDSVEARLAQAELLLLRAQVEPHFLFNTLAHLRELIRMGDGAASLAMLDHLIVYSRSVSDRIRQATHSLGQELEAAKGYLSLMGIRFGERLSFDLQIDPAVEDCEVPVGTLLIPVENAIKHGLEPLASGGRVSLRGGEANGLLTVEVQDNGPGLQASQGASRGTGLANLRERLKLQFSEAARLQVEDHEAGGVIVRISMPIWRRAATVPQS